MRRIGILRGIAALINQATMSCRGAACGRSVRARPAVPQRRRASFGNRDCYDVRALNAWAVQPVHPR